MGGIPVSDKYRRRYYIQWAC